MLEYARGLSDSQLDAISELERRVLAADGGRLKLEWRTLRGRQPDAVQDVLWWEDGALAGFAGRYEIGPAAEITGMVDPSLRRRGIASALLDALLGLCHARRPRQVLLVVPRNGAGGHEFAIGRGGVHEHSEHALLLCGDPQGATPAPGIALRRATKTDLPRLSTLIEGGFGHPLHDDDADGPRDDVLMIEHHGSAIGTIRLTLDGRLGSVHGFVIDAGLRGQGLGRRALHQACASLRARGAERVSLEVDVDNDRALSLYTALGFERVTTEDYYELPAPGDIAPPGVAGRDAEPG